MNTAFYDLEEQNNMKNYLYSNMQLFYLYIKILSKLYNYKVGWLTRINAIFKLTNAWAARQVTQVKSL